MKKLIRIVNFISYVTIALLIVFTFISCETEHFKDPLTPQEREWLVGHDRKITLAVEMNYAPFAFVDENGNSKGLATDYIELIEKKLNFRLKKVRFKSLNEILSKAQQKEIDVVNAVTETPKRSEYLLFTKSFIEIPNVIIVRKDQQKPLTINKMKDMKISLVKNYAVTEHLITNYNYMDVDLVPDDLTALLNVSFSKTNSAIIDLATASYFIEQKGITNLRIAGDAGYNIKLAIASRKDWPIFNQILAKGLLSISDKERKSIKNKWISFGQMRLFESKKFWIFILTTFTVILLSIAGIIVWNRALKRQVEQSTMRLQKELTERKQAEKALRESEQRWQFALEGAGDGVWDWNAQTNKVFFSRQWKGMLGLEENEIGDTFDEWDKRIHPEDREYTYKEINKHFTGETPAYVSEHRLKCKDGTYKWILDRGKIIAWTEEGKPLRVIGTHTDITDRKRAEDERMNLEAQLLQSRKFESIGLMAGGVAHDFNNILYMITGNAELAMEDIPEWNPIHANLKAIKSAALRAAEIVKQLLNFSRKNDQEFRPIGAVTVINDALKFLRSIIPTSIEIRKQLPDIETTILGDPTQIHQVMMNLCINASQMMEGTGGILEIIVKKFFLNDEEAVKYPDLSSGKYLQIAVKDKGPGIDTDIIDRIFDPYFTTKKVGKGSGMGLAVVHGIVKNHNGVITVDSQIGEGATFNILLPVVEEEPQVEIKAPDEIPLGNERILFIDDEESIVSMIYQMLQRLGYEAVAETNPVKALELFQSNPDRFDLIITDMTMPQMSGAKLSEKLKNIRPEVPIIICTGHSPLIDEKRAKSIGVSGYVMKPIVKGELAKAIRKVLDDPKGLNQA